MNLKEEEKLIIERIEAPSDLSSIYFPISLLVLLHKEPGLFTFYSNLLFIKHLNIPIYFGQKKLADFMGITMMTFLKRRKQLEELNLIEVAKTRTGFVILRLKLEGGINFIPPPMLDKNPQRGINFIVPKNYTEWIKCLDKWAISLSEALSGNSQKKLFSSMDNTNPYNPTKGLLNTKDYPNNSTNSLKSNSLKSKSNNPKYNNLTNNINNNNNYNNNINTKDLITKELSISGSIKEKESKEKEKNIQKREKKEKESFGKIKYNRVLEAYHKYKGVSLKGPEQNQVFKAAKEMFLAERTLEQIEAFMRWLKENEENPETPWVKNWTIWTVQKKLPEFLAGKLKTKTWEDEYEQIT
jgi:hypothetical protein